MLRNLWRSPVLIALTDVALHWSSLLSWLISQGLALRISLHWSCLFCSQRMFIWMFNTHLIVKAVLLYTVVLVFHFKQTFNLRLLTQENVLVGGFFVISGYVSAYTTTKLGALRVEASLLNMSHWKVYQILIVYSSLFCSNFIHGSLLESKSSQTNKSIRISWIVIICNYLDPTSLYPYSTGRCSRTSVSQGEEGGKPWAVLLAEGAVGLMHLMSSCVGGVWREGLWLQTEVSLWANMLLQSFRIITFQMLWYRCPYLLLNLACT